MHGTFWVRYRAKGTICNDRRSLPMPAGGAVSPPAGPGQSPCGGPGQSPCGGPGDEAPEALKILHFALP